MIARAVVLLLATVLAWPARAQSEGAAPPPEAKDDYDRLGRLEREEVDAVLAERGLTLERAPAGKSIGRIVVSTRPVFSVRDGGFLRFFNIFHVTTRERVIRRELLFHSGEPWRQEIVDETLRNLRDPLYHNVLVIVPVVGADPTTQVDVVVVVRDIWSLRLNSRWDVQGTNLINLTFSLSENNFFGMRKRLAFAFAMDQGAIAVGPSYTDPNIAGTRLTLTTAWRVVFARDGGDFEGTRSSTALTYPIWSLRQHWGGSLSVSHSVGYERRFLGTALRTYDVPETEPKETIPWIYRRRDLSTQAQVTRAFGTTLRQAFAAGHELALSRPSLVDDFPDDPALRDAFARDVLGRDELSSALFAGYELYTPTYGAYRDLETFDFREDFQLGPLASARASAAREEIGSERNFFRLSASGRWSFGWGGGLYRASAGVSTRVEDGESIDRTYALGILLVTPQLARIVRVVVAASLDWLGNDRSNRYFSLGGTTGLRGYEINEFSGAARAVGHVELRTRPLRLAFFRLGAVLFWDTGHAADAVRDLDLRHSVGAGLRSLIPQFDPLVMRVDWAIPLSGDAAGFPGRVTLGIEQAF